MATPFLGQIMAVGFNFPPRGWAFCDGQLLPISQNTALFSLLGCTFGGDCRTTFALPDLRSRSPIHVGHGPGLSNYVWGQKGGTESVTLTVNEMPSHTHSVYAQSNPGQTISPTNNTWAQDAGGQTATYSDQAGNNTMNPQSITNAGGSQSHTNIQPFLGIYFCIALQGLFPSRS